jgi:hypothetical protein
MWKSDPPKKSNAGMLPCVSVHRVSPKEVVSSASVCMFKHLLAGNLVLLGHDPANIKVAQDKHALKLLKTASHVLMNHQGAVFLHFLDTAMTLLEAVPPIEKCAGGLVPGYRLDPLAEVARQNMHGALFLSLATNPLAVAAWYNMHSALTLNSATPLQADGGTSRHEAYAQAPVDPRHQIIPTNADGRVCIGSPSAVVPPPPPPPTDKTVTGC